MSLWDLTAPRHVVGGNKANYPADDTTGATHRYVDFTAAHNGDGTTAAQAASDGAVGARNQLSIADYAPGTTWAIWIRRSGSQTLTVDFAFNQANIFFIGWPVNGDLNYHARPASGISNGWDSDVSTFAVLTCATATVSITISTGTGQKFRRLQFINTSADTGSGHFWVKVNITCELTNCDMSFIQGAGGTSTALWVKSLTGTASDVSLILTNVTVETSRGGVALLSEFNCASYINCQFANTSSSAAGNIVHVKDGSQQLFQDCVLIVTSGTSLQKLLLVDVTGSSTPSQPVFLGCRFDIGPVTTQGTNIDIQAACTMLSCTFRGHKLNATVSGGAVEWQASTNVLHFSEMHFLAWSFNSQLTSVVPMELVADNITFDTDNSQPIQAICSKFIFNNVKLPGADDWTTSSNDGASNRDYALLEHPGMFSYDHVSIAGKYRRLTDEGTLTFGQSTMGASPAGGTFQGNVNTNAFGPVPRYMPMEVNDPDDDTFLVFLTAGTRTITCYMNSHTSMYDFFLHIEYLDQVSGAHRATASSYSGSVATTGDFSWHPVSVTISVGQNCWAQVRLSYADGGGGGVEFDTQVVIS